MTAPMSGTAARNVFRISYGGRRHSASGVLGWLRGFLLAAGLSWIVASSASTDLTAFNQAVNRNDFAAAAAAAKEIWPTYDRNSPKTAAVAREFGMAAYVAGDYEAARKFARFLVAEGARLVPADNRPLTARVLLEASDLQLDPGRKQRRKLFEALDAHRQAEDADTIAMLAAGALVRYDIGNYAWRDAEKSAGVAADLASKRGDTLLNVRRNMEVTAIAARYLAERSTDSLTAMSDLHDAIVADAERLPSGVIRSSLMSLQYQTSTWTTAMLDYFRSLLSVTGNSLAAQFEYRLPDPRTLDLLERRELRSIAPARTASEGHELPPAPLCNGSMKAERQPVYPSNASYRGLAGAVLLSIDIAPNGEAKDVQVLAAVPADVFSQAAVKAFSNSRFDPSADQDLSRCRVERSDYQVMLRFRLQ